MLDDQNIHIIKKLDSVLPGNVYLGSESKHIMVYELPKKDLITDNIPALKQDLEKMRRLVLSPAVSLYQFYDEKHAFYLISDMPPGKLLLDCMLDFELQDRFVIMLRIAEALSVMHQYGIVHGNLQPGTVYVEKENGMSCVLTGYSIFHVVSKENQYAESGNSNMPNGTQGQSEYAPVFTMKSDLYSLGCLFYEMITGTIPFDYNKDVDRSSSGPVELFPVKGVPQWLGGIVTKLLNKDQDNRYDSIFDLVAELKHGIYVIEKIHAERYDTQVNPVIAGRQKELRILKNCLENAVHGFGQTVVISGETGVGKSSLVNSFFGAGIKDRQNLLSFSCNEATSNTPYAPFIAMVRDYINRLKTDADLIYKIISSMGEGRAFFINIIADEYRSLLSADEQSMVLENRADRQLFFQAILQFLNLVAESEQLLVLFIDNVHFIDSNSADLVQYIITGMDDSHILMLLCLQNIFPKQVFDINKLEKKNNTVHIVVQSFSKEQLPVLVKSILNTSRDFEPVLYDKIYDNSLGVPLYVANIINLLTSYQIISMDKKTGVYEVDKALLHSLNIDNDISVLVKKRLKDLNTDEREVLEMASVAGRQFTFSEISGLYHEVKGYENDKLLLSVLNKANRNQLCEKKDENTWSFCHDKIHETIYKTVSTRVRAEYHLIIGEVLESKNKQNLDSVLFQIAFHYNNTMHAKKLLLYNEKAYKKALSLYSLPEAVYYLRIVLDYYIANHVYVPQLTDLVIDGSAVMHACGYVADSFSYLDKVRELFKTDISPEDEIRIVSTIAAGHYYTNELDQAVAYCEKALELANVLDHYHDLGNLYFVLGSVNWFIGNLPAAQDYLNSAYTYFEGSDMRLAVLAMRSATSLFMGDLQSTAIDVKEIENAVRGVDNPIVLPQLFHCMSLYYAWGHVDYSKAEICSLASYEKAKKDSNIIFMYSSMVGLATVYYFQGKLDDAIACIDQSMVISRENNISVGINFVQALRAEIELMAGNIDSAYDSACRYLEQSAGKETLPELLYLKIKALYMVIKGEFHGIAEVLNKAFEIITASGMYLPAFFFEEYYCTSKDSIPVDESCYADFKKGYDQWSRQPASERCIEIAKKQVEAAVSGQLVDKARVEQPGKDTESTDNLNVVNDVLSSCGKGRNVQHMSELLLAELGPLLGFREGAVVFARGDYFPLETMYFMNDQFDIVKEVVGMTQQSGDLCVYPGPDDHDELLVNALMHKKVKSVYCRQLVAQNRNLGYLYLQNRYERMMLSETQLSMLNVIISQFSYMAENRILQKIVDEQYTAKISLQQLLESYNISKRESEIIGFMRKGLSNREMADAAGVSETTIKTHVYHIFRKINVKSRAELLSMLK